MANVISRYEDVLRRVKDAAAAAGRDFTAVIPMLAIKYARNEDILTLINSLDSCHAGESRVQDARGRWAGAEFQKIRHKVTLHYIGQLQSNKIAKAVALFDFIDSISDPGYAALINAKAKEQNKTVRAMLQIKLTDKDAQGGVKLQDAAGLIKAIGKFENIDLCGVMAVAPQVSDAETLRPLFREVRNFWERNLGDKKEKYLSLGMSGDFEAAVKEGSTMPRLGSAIFQ